MSPGNFVTTHHLQVMGLGIQHSTLLVQLYVQTGTY